MTVENLLFLDGILSNWGRLRINNNSDNKKPHLPWNSDIYQRDFWPIDHSLFYIYFDRLVHESKWLRKKLQGR